MDLKKLSETFARDGFVVIQQLWDPCFSDEVEREFERFVREVVPGMPRDNKVYLSGWDGPLKSLGGMERFDPFFEGLKNRDDLCQIATALLGHQARAFGVEYFGRPPHSDAVAPYHQDNAYFCYEPAEALAFWIPLDHVKAANGGMVYAAGSHTAGLLPHGASGIHGFSQGMVDPDTRLAAFTEVEVEIPRGGCAIHHALTAHRSGPNPTDSERRVLVVDCKTPRTREDNELRARMAAELEQLLKAVGAREE